MTDPDDYETPDSPSFDEPDGIVDGYEMYEGVTYRETPERNLKLNLFLPEDVTTASLIINVPGSGYGEVELEGTPWHDAEEGWAFAVIEHRPVQEAIFPAAIRDMAAAVTWLRTKAAEPAGIDPDTLVIRGNSSGAHLVNLIANSPGEQAFHPIGLEPHLAGIDGAISLGTFYDIRGMAAETIETLLGCTYEECPDDYAKASPITHVDSDIVPPLIWHGTENSAMDVEDAREYTIAAGSGFSVGCDSIFPDTTTVDRFELWSRLRQDLFISDTYTSN